MRLFIQQAKIHSITLFPLPDNPMQIVEVREPLEKEESVGDKWRDSRTQTFFADASSHAGQRALSTALTSATLLYWRRRRGVT